MAVEEEQQPLEEEDVESPDETITRIVKELLKQFRPHYHRTYGMHNITLGNPLWHPYFWTDIQGRVEPDVLGVAWVILHPIYFAAPMTISIMTCQQTIAGGLNTSLRLGLYADNGGTPQGGALLADSGNIGANVVAVHNFTFPAPISVRKGVPVWAALEAENATMAFLLCQAERDGFIEIGAEMMGGCNYVRGGGFGALTDPCPVVAAQHNTRFYGFVRVDSVQPL
jgi:hypothetical protein